MGVNGIKLEINLCLQVWSEGILHVLYGRVL